MKKLIWNKHTQLLLRHLIGWCCIVLGLIMLITPGQGLLTLLLGVYLLADHVPFFGKIKVRIQEKFPRAADYTHRQVEKLKTRFHK